MVRRSYGKHGRYKKQKASRNKSQREKHEKGLVRPIPRGMERQWVRCRTCGRVGYYDYTPGGLSNPARWLKCGHSLGVDWYEAVENMTAAEAMSGLTKAKQ